jgi:hypothetical protein
VKPSNAAVTLHHSPLADARPDERGARRRRYRSALPGRREQQDEPAQHVLVGPADQGGEMLCFTGPKSASAIFWATSALALATLRAASGVGLGEFVGKLGAFGLPAPVFLSAKIAPIAATVRGVPVLRPLLAYATHQSSVAGRPLWERGGGNGKYG